MSKVVTAVVLIVGALVAGERVLVNFASRNRIANVQETKSDLKQLLQNSDEHSSISKVDPQSEAGKELKPIMARMQRREEEFIKEFDRYAVPNAFDWEHLATPEGRAQTLKGLDGELTACRKVYSDTCKMRAEIQAIVKKHSRGQSSSRVDEMNSEDGKLERARVALYAKYKKYIQAIANSKLTKRDGETFFVHDADRKKCDALLTDMVKTEEEFESSRKALLENRLAARQAAITRLGS